MADSTAKNIADAFTRLKSDYSAARTSRFRRRRQGVPTMGAGADYHYRSESDYLRLMEEARDFDRNDMAVGQMIDRAVSNTIQDGFSILPDTGDKAINKELKAKWVDWIETPDECHIEGELTFWEMEQLNLRHILVDGDIIDLPNADSGGLELVEGHRLRTPNNTTRNVVHGVLLEESTRKRLQYWFTRENLNPLSALRLVSDVKQFDVRDAAGNRQIFHPYRRKRASQTRGVTAFAPIFDLCGMFEDIQVATLFQRQAVACFALFIKRLQGWQPPTKAGDQTLAGVEDQTTDWRKFEMKPGTVVRTAANEEASFQSPNIPNPEFFPHMKMILSLIGINVGLPLVMVLMDASETNFNGWRGAIEQARMGFRDNQRMLANHFHAPVYRWKVRDFMATDPALANAAKKSGIDIFGHWINPPTWPYIQPLQDASADLMRLGGGLISQRRRCNERGMEWDDLSREIIDDNSKHIFRALKRQAWFKKKFSVEIDWREIAYPTPPKGLNISMNLDPMNVETQGAKTDGK